jgi:hypothetical protein
LGSTAFYSGKSRASFQQQQQQQECQDADAAGAAADCSAEQFSPAPMEVEEPQPPAAAAAAEPGSEKAASATATAAGAVDVLRVASLRALAAYNALAVCISQQKLHALAWLLQQLQQDNVAATAAAAAGSGSSSTSAATGPSVQQVLVAQQRIAWAGLVTGQQVPLLLLAHLPGNARVIQVCGVS